MKQVRGNTTSSTARLNFESLDQGQSCSDDDLEYNLRTENLPDVPIYDARLQNALRETKEQLRKLHEVMDFGPGIANPAPNLATLAQQTDRLSEFEYPQFRTIGLVGDSGVGKEHRETCETQTDARIGKSSLINSLLDERGIAKSVRGISLEPHQEVTNPRRVAMEAHARILSLNTDIASSAAARIIASTLTTCHPKKSRLC
jgi:hypothetical protein